ncbi:hypothetical protein D9758_008982 [Tetrapyrgos nigripes]|uniref:UBR-type domain-containing protein n=1 Tax=Tetrapyrgos nigripes TaxID=182062 RepID=A0A8H5GKU8_9AGAR|nr:hypothetical protein D9758_008982 [Tetrapyrgos nigripes]
MSQNQEETLSGYLESQANLVQEASEALPHQFSQCTYPLGPLRQALYLCLTCPEARGICSACSISCHTDHEQIELFPKRSFCCDCPTQAIAHPCSLHTTLEVVNVSNTYGQNFNGLFCRCHRTYDANKEREAMIQCLACEDWFHESCCNLRERPPSRESSPEHKDQDEASKGPEDDAQSTTSSSGLPPPLIGPSDYDSFVCTECVSKSPILRRWAGTPGCLMVIRDSPSSPWRVLCGDPEDKNETLEVVAGTKRPSSPSLPEETDLERPRLSPSASASIQCLAPPPNPIAQRILSDGNPVMDPDTSLGFCDIFLTEGFRNRWCHCDTCGPLLAQYLSVEEETYEPPEDPDSGLSLEELGMRALSRLPRERAIDGIHAFNSMRDDLKNYLRPFAEQGKVVNEADVKSFFESLMERKTSA